MLEELRQNGKRLTTARRLLLEQLAGADHHLTVDELTELVQRRHPDVHRATVYRTLETLTDMGMVEHSHIGHGAAVYHLRGDLHQHLLCETCGGVTEVPASLFRELERTLSEDYGFVMRPMHFAVVGRCRRCVDDDQVPARAHAH